ncbi:AfsR/SARP family transcriptional regulator [Streptomyces sp. NPDC001135]
MNLWIDSHTALPTAKKQRKVIALLLLNSPTVVPVSSFFSEIWGERLPATARTTLQTYVVLLRKLLAQAMGVPTQTVAREVLQTRGAAYAFCLGEGWSDLREYRSLERDGNAALAEGNHRQAVELFRRAESLWHGPALADVEHGRLLEAEVARLEQSRMTMIGHRIDAELHLGHHRTVLSELAGLVAEHHVDEDLNAKFILALYRSGHRSRALEAYERLRTAMIHELGLDPSPALQRLHRGVLESDPALEHRLQADRLSPAGRNA